MQKKILISVILSVLLVGGTIYLVSNGAGSTNPDDMLAQVNNVEMRDGTQYVTITALGGYSPRVSIVQPDVPTKLVVKTNGTYDCSAALVVRDVGFKKVLQPTGEEVIDLGVLQKGATIQGLCSMGMYSFQIKTS